LQTTSWANGSASNVSRVTPSDGKTAGHPKTCLHFEVVFPCEETYGRSQEEAAEVRPALPKTISMSIYTFCEQGTASSGLKGMFPNVSFQLQESKLKPNTNWS